MDLATILIDTREQTPWTFEDYPVSTSRETIRTGDYTVVDLCDHDADLDTYFPQCAVERKTGSDFLQSLTWENDRFTDELSRADDWPVELKVVVEEPYSTFQQNMGCMRHRDVDPDQIISTLETIQQHYNVSFSFVGTRDRAEQVAFDTLLTYVRTVGDD